MEINKIYNMDCLEGMKQLEDKQVDMILCDLPYGTTACEWDEVIPLDKMWKEMIRISKDNCAMVFTASQPFTSKLVMSNIKMFKHEWIWKKQKASNFMSFKFHPAKYHENIIVFGKKKVKYNPQMWMIEENKKDKRKTINNPITNKDCHLGSIKRIRKEDDGSRYPKSILEINKSINKNVHPTQKPIELFKYLIKTYSNKNDLILDCVMGSGTTALACKQLGRKCIGIEISQKYCDVIYRRLIKENKQMIL